MCLQSLVFVSPYRKDRSNTSCLPCPVAGESTVTSTVGAVTWWVLDFIKYRDWCFHLFSSQPITLKNGRNGETKNCPTCVKSRGFYCHFNAAVVLIVRRWPPGCMAARTRSVPRGENIYTSFPCILYPWLQVIDSPAGGVVKIWIHCSASSVLSSGQFLFDLLTFLPVVLNDLCFCCVDLW